MATVEPGGRDADDKPLFTSSPPTIPLMSSDSSPPVDSDSTTYTVEEAIDHIGYGRFHWLLFFYTGMAWCGDAMEVQAERSLILDRLTPASAPPQGLRLSVCPRPGLR